MPCTSPLVMSIRRVDGRFSLKSILGVGSHAIVCLAQNVISDEEVAVKLESFTGHLSESPLKQEFMALMNLQGSFGIPQPIWFGRESLYQALVLDSIATPLCNIVASQGGLLSLNSVLLIGCQLTSVWHCSIATPPLESTSHTKRDVPSSVPQHFLLSAITAALTLQLPPPEDMCKSIMAAATMLMTICMRHLNADSPTKACGRRNEQLPTTPH
ncbi:hypothetical protein BKA83DRAFT_4127764 [Pisolithus microcarpus]|nr:hypothetical protein BKA83DRAFT_4127764 [Pisolithus microcarpus]